MQQADGGIALARSVEKRVWFGLVGANLAAALLVIPGAFLVTPALLPAVDRAYFLTLNIGAGIPYMLFACTSGFFFVVRPTLRPAIGWLLAERPPTEAECILVATQPRRQSVRILAYWVLFLGVAIPLNFLAFEIDGLAVAKAVNGLFLLAFVGWTLSYLLVERAVRPVLALALAGAPRSEPRTMGVFLRLLVAWAAAAGLPLWTIAVLLYGLDTEQRALVIPYIYFNCAASFVAGIIATVIASRAITDPLAKVRHGLRAIEQGEFDVEIPVDEGSEIGVLQMGFNRMAHGLRERERMREIFGRHVGAEVAARALAEDLGLAGERRQATAMFIDVISSTELTQREDPDDVVAKLNALLDAVVHCISAEGGLINKFLGDGALCVFGAPNDQPDHAARALRAARCLSAQLENIEGLRAAIGISSGEVVAGNVGTADRYEYTVIGDAVNEASRLTEQAKLNGSNVLVSSETIAAAGHEARLWREYGSFELRGRTEPTIAFEPASV